MFGSMDKEIKIILGSKKVLIWTYVFYIFPGIWLRQYMCGKCSKISNTFLFLFSNKMLVIRAGSHKMVVRIANREDPDQTASSDAV